MGLKWFVAFHMDEVFMDGDALILDFQVPPRKAFAWESWKSTISGNVVFELSIIHNLNP